MFYQVSRQLPCPIELGDRVRQPRQDRLDRTDGPIQLRDFQFSLLRFDVQAQHAGIDRASFVDPHRMSGGQYGDQIRPQIGASSAMKDVMRVRVPPKSVGFDQRGTVDRQRRGQLAIRILLLVTGSQVVMIIELHRKKVSIMRSAGKQNMAAGFLPETGGPHETRLASQLEDERSTIACKR